MQDQAKPWHPNLLSATPTLEMGINIGDLSTLILCSVPPEQANYVQRIGRAGRRDGNALNVTVAMARPHDMWFWTDPLEMISGQVKTPGVHLEAVAILRRQFAAFTLDRWVAEEGAYASSYGRVGQSLKAIKGDVRRGFPLFWFDFIAKHATRLFEDFVKLFPELTDNNSARTSTTLRMAAQRTGLRTSLPKNTAMSRPRSPRSRNWSPIIRRRAIASSRRSPLTSTLKTGSWTWTANDAL